MNIANNSKSKTELLYIKQVLKTEIDEDFARLMYQTIERLVSYDTPFERKGAYCATKVLCNFGPDTVPISVIFWNMRLFGVIPVFQNSCC